MLAVCSSGAADRLSTYVAAFSAEETVCIAYLGLDEPSDARCIPLSNDTERVNGLRVIQRIRHNRPYNLLWSENSAHLVVITVEYIFLYNCTERADSAEKWHWELERTVSAPRDLTEFRAGYSHPLLSLEQRATLNPSHMSTSGDLVVINLMCSLFQTFSVANTHAARFSSGLPISEEVSSPNKLSVSGRYLSTAQILPGAQQGSPTTMGVRVYDLVDLWVLKPPSVASYLDFKYADLPLQTVPVNSSMAHNSAMHASRSSTPDSYQIGTETSVHQEGTSWDVQQLQWRHSDSFSMGPDSVEIFFISQLCRSHTKAPVCSSQGSIAESMQAVSMGIAELPEDVHTPAPDPMLGGGYADVTVSIYAVSQQPDHDNINIVTMAYNAAIVAGQLKDEYSLNPGTLSSQGSSRDNLSGLATPIPSNNSAPCTTVVNLITVVSLTSMLREVPTTDPTIKYVQAEKTMGSKNSSLCGEVFVCWVEPSHSINSASPVIANLTNIAGTGSTSKSSKTVDEKLGDSGLNLAVQYSANYFTNSASQTIPELESWASRYVLFSIQNRQYEGNTTCSTENVSTNTAAITNPPAAFGNPMNMRCLHLANCNGNAKHTRNNILECIFVSQYRIGSFLHSTTSLLSAIHMQKERPSSNLSKLNVYDCRKLLIQDELEKRCGIEVNLLPSSNVHLRLIDTERSIYSVQHVNNCENTATGWSWDMSFVSLINLRALDLTIEIKSAVQVPCTDDFRIYNLYVLYCKNDKLGEYGWSYHVAVFRCDRSEYFISSQNLFKRRNAIKLSLLAANSNCGGNNTVPWRLSRAGADSAIHSPYEYTTFILPDPHFGLGIRIDVMDGRTVVSSFKKHPITNKPMSAQSAGVICPGDEFVAINGKILRGLALPEVIHTIRTTVSENGDEPATLTMCRTGLSQGNLALNKSSYTLPPHLRSVSSNNSLSSVISSNSLSDGLDKTNLTPSLSLADSKVDKMSEIIPQDEKWIYSCTHDLSPQAWSADIAVSTSSPFEAYLAALHLDSCALHPTLLMWTLSTSTASECVLKVDQMASYIISNEWVARKNDINNSDRQHPVLQLWPNTEKLQDKGERTYTEENLLSELAQFHCSILIPSANLDELPSLLTFGIFHDSPSLGKRIMRRESISLVRVSEFGKEAQLSRSPTECWRLLQFPSTPSSLSVISLSSDLSSRTVDGCTVVDARMRKFEKNANIPLHLPESNVLSCRVMLIATSCIHSDCTNQALNPLNEITRLLNILALTNKTTTNDKASEALANLIINGRYAEPIQSWVYDEMEYSATALAHQVLVTLQSLTTTCCPDLTTASFASYTKGVNGLLDGYALDEWGRRAVTLRLLERTTTAENRAECRASSAFVANLLFASSASQLCALRMLLPGTSSVGPNVANEEMILARGNFSDNGDILSTLVDMHVALWLRDLTPLIEIIQKNALTAFKQSKSSIQIFLEMILIGKEDTLLQLAKTDKEKTGRQLLALLSLDDTFTSDKTRKSLQKNAFALMKLHRYRDAAAVFLLADPPFIKEASSVLTLQFEQPFLALLVTRLVEHRQAVRRQIAQSKSGRILDGKSLSQLGAEKLVCSSDGHALSSASRRLIETDILPSLLRTYQNSTVAAQQVQLQQSHLNCQSQQRTRQVGIPLSAAYSGFNGSDGAILGLVSSLWLQSPQMLRDTYNQLFSHYSLVDICLSMYNLSGETKVTSEIIKTLGSIDWLLEVSAYIGAEAYRTSLHSTQELLANLDLHDKVLQIPMWSTRITLKSVLERVHNNTYIQHCQCCFEAHLARQQKQEELQLLPPQLSPIGDNTPFSASNSVPGTPLIITGANTPVTIASEDSEYTAILKRVATFQSSESITPSGSMAAGIAANNNSSLASEPLAGHSPLGTLESSNTLSSQVRSGGFNFSTIARSNPTSAPTQAKRSLLDTVDVPAAAVRKNLGAAKGSSRGSGRRIGATLDILSEPSMTTSPAPAQQDQPLSEANSSTLSEVKEDGDSTQQPKVASIFDLSGVKAMSATTTILSTPHSALDASGIPPTLSRRAVNPISSIRRGREGASLDLLGDIADVVSPPPVRITNSLLPSEPAKPTDLSSPPVYDRSAMNPGATSSNNHNLAKIENSEEQVSKSAFNFAAVGLSRADNSERNALDSFDFQPKRPQRGTTNVLSSGTRRTGASLDLLNDVESFAPPIRHSTPALSVENHDPSVTSAALNKGSQPEVKQYLSKAMKNDIRSDGKDEDKDPFGTSRAPVRSALDDFDMMIPQRRHHRTYQKAEISNASAAASPMTASTTPTNSSEDAARDTGDSVIQNTPGTAPQRSKELTDP